MKFLMNKYEGKRGFAAKLLCLNLAVLMLLASCGKGGTASKENTASGGENKNR